MQNIIEPCCAERQLGQLLREANGQAALFQTNGDVTAKLFIKDTMLLSGDRPRTLTIAASEMPQEAMRLISRYAQLGYISRLRLMLPSDVSPQPSDLISHFSSLIPHFDVDLSIVDTPLELMMWRGSSHTVVIQGAMPDTVSPALHLYGGQLGGNNTPAIRAATAAFEALFRARRVESLTPDPSPEGEGSEDNDSTVLGDSESLTPDPSPEGEGSEDSESTVLGDSVADNTSALSPQPSDIEEAPKRTSRKKKSEI